MPCNILFKGSLQESVKSNIYLGSGVKTLLFVFNPLENSSVNLTWGVYLVSDRFFGLYPSEPVILQSGLYNFFSLSFNDIPYPYINFDATYSAIPENGKDYIWASREFQYVTGNHYIEFLYKHIATNINIVVDVPPSFTNVSFNYIKHTLPNCHSSSLNLKTGVITPATLVHPLETLAGTGTSRAFIAIPCSAQKQVEVSINATIEGQGVNNLIYRAYVNDSFEAGMLYTVNLSIQDLFNSSLTLSRNEWSYHSNTITY